MLTLITILIIIAAILLILVVLIQNPKGGGIASNFSAGNTIMGVKRTTDFIEKLTWGLAIAIIVLSISTTMFTGTTEGGDAPDSQMDEQIQESTGGAGQQQAPPIGGGDQTPPQEQ